ncbi:hypothetical protein CN386_06350 [Bacillus cereus]|nr:hypothetical protein CN386_06350 [Bacillus cereus]BCD30381.1 hypothetical protein BC30102_3417 [Bacillus cereus]
MLDKFRNLKYKVEITKRIEKSYSRIADKIEKEQAKKAEENKKVHEKYKLNFSAERKRKLLRKR